VEHDRSHRPDLRSASGSCPAITVPAARRAFGPTAILAAQPDARARDLRPSPTRERGTRWGANRRWFGALKVGESIPPRTGRGRLMLILGGREDGLPLPASATQPGSRPPPVARCCWTSPGRREQGRGIRAVARRVTSSTTVRATWANPARGWCLYSNPAHVVGSSSRDLGRGAARAPGQPPAGWNPLSGPTNFSFVQPPAAEAAREDLPQAHRLRILAIRPEKPCVAGSFLAM
jgi:hypothetical protein